MNLTSESTEEHQMRAIKYLRAHGQKLIDITNLPYAHHSQFGSAYVVGTTRRITDQQLSMVRRAFSNMNLLENIFALIDFVETGHGFSGVVFGESAIHFYQPVEIDGRMHAAALGYNELQSFCSSSFTHILSQPQSVVMVEKFKFFTNDLGVAEWMDNFALAVSGDVDLEDENALSWTHMNVLNSAHHYISKNCQDLVEGNPMIFAYGTTNPINGRYREQLYKLGLSETVEIIVTNVHSNSDFIVFAQSGIHCLLKKKESFVSYYDLLQNETTRNEFQKIVLTYEPTVLDRWTKGMISFLQERQVSDMMGMSITSFSSARQSFGQNMIRVPANSVINQHMHHVWNIKTYHSPTFCCFCNNMLMGIVKQGYRCSKCKIDVHKSCINAMVGFRCLLENHK